MNAFPSTRFLQKSSTNRNLARLVDPLTGTGEQQTLPGAYSGGETFPGADLPFGMVQWSPDTVSRAYSGYTYTDQHVRGFSLTHLSGAGCSDYGDIPFMPYPGPVIDSPATSAREYSSRFSHAAENAYAGYYEVQLSNGVDTALSVTPHSGAGRFIYPAGQAASMLINLAGSLNGASAAQANIGVDRTTISGWISSGNFCYLKRNTYRVYFWAQFSQPFATSGTWQKDQLNRGQRTVAGAGAGVFVTFAANQPHTFSLRVGISFVSVANAEANVNQENPVNDFASVQRQAVQTWDSWLGRIGVSGGSSAQLVTFYTALYHALLFPSTFSDVDGEYPGFDEKIHSVVAGHVQYANFSGWDMYRSQAQLLALLAPAQASDMAQSLLNDYSQGGSLPKWALANSETYVQVGDPALATIADFYAFGATTFDARAALAAMLKQATLPSQVRPGLNYLETPGYEPSDGVYGCCNAYGPASTTLEYAQADFALGSLAGMLDDPTDARRFVQRAQNWRNLFNPATGYLEPRARDGSFPQDFSPTNNRGWVEGNSAQYTWMVPFNLHGLFNALGGNADVVRRLDTFFSQLNAGLDQPYAFLGNEPSFAVPWEYDYAGAAYKTQQVVHQIVNTLYHPGPQGLPGNDDLGEMSSWYVFAALGMYPETPGTASLVLASPLFPSITLTRASGQIIQINAPAVSANSFYVQRLTVNGLLSTRPWLPAAFIERGGTLDYTLGRLPDRIWGAQSADAPPSYA